MNYHAYEFDGVLRATAFAACFWGTWFGFWELHHLLFHAPPLRQGRQRVHWYANSKVRVFFEPLFRRWIRKELAKKDMDHKLPQSVYVKGCQHVIKFEELHERWDEIAKVMGLASSAKLPRLVVGRQNTERIAAGLSPKTKKLIQELYPNDFESLGYDR